MRNKKEKQDYQGENKESKKKKPKKGLIVLGVIVCLIIIATVSSNVKSKIEHTKFEKELAQEKEERRQTKLEWPSDSPLAQMLPVPAAEHGIVNQDSSEYLSVEIYDISKEDYQTYVSGCKEKGFIVDYYSSDSSYRAENENGYRLNISYDEDENEYSISLKVPENTSEDTGENTVEGTDDQRNSSENTDGKSISSQENDSTVTPEFKEAMDSYEKFFDEYVSFMKKYTNSSDTTAMLSDYAKYMQRYSDCMQKLDAIDTDTLSTADMAYYMEVTGRIYQKLGEITN